MDYAWPTSESDPTAISPRPTLSPVASPPSHRFPAGRRTVAATTPTPIPTLHGKSVARKLLKKRKPASDIDPNHDPLILLTPRTDADAPFPSSPGDGYNDGEDDEVSEYGSAGAEGGAGGDLRCPPFKFHRIWSQSDEIRFLQGLVGCWSLGMVFPRDLNLFYNRFLEPMSQPYEKLRRRIAPLASPP